MRIAEEDLVALLPADLTYRTMIEEFRFCLLRRGLDVEMITADTVFLIKGTSTIIAGEEDFMSSYKKFTDSLWPQQANQRKYRTLEIIRSPRNVWLLARPTSHAVRFSYLAESSHGSFPLCHWGVLVTDLSLKTFPKVIQSETSASQGSFLLGDLYELFQGERGNATANRTSPFLVNDLRRDWRMVSFKFVGTTLKTDTSIMAQG